MANEPGEPQVDIAAVTRLVEALERDLAKVRAGEGDVASLRAEVEALRSALGRADTVGPHEVHGPLGRVQALLHVAGDELRADALPASDYILRIGKMLGM